MKKERAEGKNELLLGAKMKGEEGKCDNVQSARTQINLSAFT
jgi:hypothetical protein